MPELLRLAHNGLLALPEFQRPFVWEPNRVLDLLDSVLNGWPVGSLLLLEGPQPFKIREIEGAPKVFDEEVEFYLLDGQQRVTALYHALTGTSRTVYFADFDEVDEDGRPRLRWAPRRTFADGNSGSMKISFELLLQPDAFDLALEGATSQMAEWMLDARRMFTSDDSGSTYRLPAIVMEQSISLEALTRIFETLNRTGVRLNSFDLMVAVLYPSGFNLREEWQTAQAQHGLLDLFETSGLEILKLIALWQREIDLTSKERPASRRVTGIRQRDVLNIPPSSVEEFWPRAVQAYSRALMFVRNELGVQDGDGLPSDTMVLTMAYFLERGTSTPALVRWFWSSIAMQTYAQGANTQILTDIRTGHPPTPSEEVVRAAIDSSLGDEIRRNKILRLGLRALARLHEDLDPVTGLPFRGPVVEVSSSALVSDRFLLDGDAAVAGLIFISKESLQLLRKRRTVVGEAVERLDIKALVSQGFPSGIDNANVIQDLTPRADVLAGRIMERLS